MIGIVSLMVVVELTLGNDDNDDDDEEEDVNDDLISLSLTLIFAASSLSGSN